MSWTCPTRWTTGWCGGWTITLRTVFEVQPVEAGGQSTICGGGRYDGLIAGLGGRPTPGIGFATGIERLTLNLQRGEVSVPDEPAPQYLVANVGDAARGPALELAVKLRRAGVGAILSSGSRGLRGQNAPGQRLGHPLRSDPRGRRN